MIVIGTARPKSPRSAPLHLVPKKDNGWRTCGDYNILNARVVPDRYPIGHIHDSAHNVVGCKIFSTLDLLKACQSRCHSEDRYHHSIWTFQMTLYDFGLRNAVQTFQCFMLNVTRWLYFVYCHLDDILMSSSDEDQHADHLCKVFIFGIFNF
jgi:hypothetical protein